MRVHREDEGVYAVAIIYGAVNGVYYEFSILGNIDVLEHPIGEQLLGLTSLSTNGVIERQEDIYLGFGNRSTINIIHHITFPTSCLNTSVRMP